MSGRVDDAYGVFVLGDENKLVLQVIFNGLFNGPYPYDRAHEEARELAAEGKVVFVLKGYRPINQAEPGGE